MPASLAALAAGTMTRLSGVVEPASSNGAAAPDAGGILGAGPAALLLALLALAGLLWAAWALWRERPTPV